MRILVDGMQGLGDGIYIRGFVKTLAATNDVTICTPWPELYTDMPHVKLQKKHTNLRTQLKSQNQHSAEVWSTEASFDKTLNINYDGGSIIPTNLQTKFGCAPTWGLPSFKEPKINKPYVVVRPATLRKEWFASARSPKPEYIDQVCRWLRDRFHIVSVADLEGGHEWLDGDAPFAHEQYHNGELNTAELLGMCQGAAAVVGGVGWIVPFALSGKSPAFIISGGNGGYSGPDRLVNHTMDLSKIHFAKPDQFCECRNMVHDCNKHISDLKGQFDDWQQVL